MAATSAESAALAVFDLGSESDDLYAQQKGVRRGFTFLSIIFTGMLLWFVDIALSYGIRGGGWILFPVVFFCLSAVLGEFFAIIWKWQRGAIRMEIRDQGIAFTWHFGRTELLSWNAVSKDIMLRDSSGDGWAVPGSTGNWELRRWNRPVTRIPHAAFDRVIQAATAKGLVVKEQTMGSRPWRWLGYRRVRFAVGAESRAQD